MYNETQKNMQPSYLSTHGASENLKKSKKYYLDKFATNFVCQNTLADSISES